MRYLIHCKNLGVHYTAQFDPELHLRAGQEMTIYDLRDNRYSVDGRTWKEISTIDLDLITLQPEEIKDAEIGVRIKIYDEDLLVLQDPDTDEIYMAADLSKDQAQDRTALVVHSRLPEKIANDLPLSREEKQLMDRIVQGFDDDEFEVIGQDPDTGELLKQYKVWVSGINDALIQRYRERNKQ